VTIRYESASKSASSNPLKTCIYYDWYI
jgi:hypothetical protein